MSEVGMFLSDEDVKKLTGRKKHRAQMRQLDRLGVKYYIDADLKPVVPTENVTQGAQVNATAAKPQPDWSVFNGPKKATS